jgi:hypothetical protein
MGGWGAVSLTVAPDGTALPCPSAATLPALDHHLVRALVDEAPLRNSAYAYREGGT